MKTKFITIPKGEELNEVMRIYKDKWQFPMCAGAIDGTHIPIIAPVVDHVDYVNWKGYHSIVMQAVVDSKYLFRDVVVGWPGSVHGTRIFSNSCLYKKGNEDTLFSSDVSETVQGCDIQPLLLGDPAYPLLAWLVKGYRENSNTSDVEGHFNFMLSKNDSGKRIRKVERAFAEICEKSGYAGGNACECCCSVLHIAEHM